MSFYMQAVEKDVCPYCNGKKTMRYSTNDETSYEGPCAYCKGTGKPTDEDKRKAELERDDRCTRCGALNAHHGGSEHSAQGCAIAAHARLGMLEETVEHLNEDAEIFRKKLKENESLEKRVEELEKKLKELRR